MHERTPEEEATSRLAVTALALAHSGARAQDICNAIDTDCRNAGLTLSRRQLGRMAQLAVRAARNDKRAGRRPPTTATAAPPATPASDPPVVTSTTQARDDRDRSAGIPIVPDTPAADETPLGHMSNVRELGRRRLRPFDPVPKHIGAQWLPDLSEAELKCYLYIAMRTKGFGKDQDAISLGQFEHGITTHDGRKLDRGTGLCRRGVAKALNSLIDKGLIERTTNQTGAHGNMPSFYRLIDPSPEEP